VIPFSYEGRQTFIVDNTRLQSPPHTPELQLYLADEVTPLWKLTEEALQEIGLPPPFWAFAWAGGQALARYILDHPEEVAGKTVIDFATGSGMASDIDAYCGPAVGLNALANGVDIHFTTDDLLQSPPPAAEVILAGDICYEGPLASRVMDWLRTARASGSRVLIGDPGRTYFDRSGLVHLAEYQVPTTRELEDYAIKRTSVWALP